MEEDKNILDFIEPNVRFTKSGRQDIAFVLNKLNMFDDASTNVTVILAPDPASSDTKIDFTTDVLNDGTVYSVVRFVVVRSAFLLIKLFAINL